MWPVRMATSMGGYLVVVVCICCPCWRVLVVIGVSYVFPSVRFRSSPPYMWCGIGFVRDGFLVRMLGCCRPAILGIDPAGFPEIAFPSWTEGVPQRRGPFFLAEVC